MKKLLACLLIMVMLPAAAFAQSIAYEWTIDMPEDALVDLIQSIGDSWPELMEDLAVAEEGLLRGAAKLMDGLDIDLQTQDQWTKVNLRLRDEDFLTAFVYVADDALYCILEDLPGIALTLPVMAQQDAFSDSMQAVADINWLALAETVDRIINEWMLTLPTAIESGSFAGEAYTGGVYRMTYQIDDRDLFVLMERLAHYESLLVGFPSLERVCALIDMDIQTLLEEVRAAAYQAAMTNNSTYLVHSISDGEYLTGLSVVAYQKDKQVGTLSLGWQDEGFKAVLGYGYQGRNVYFSAESVGVHWDLKMVVDEALAGYTAACQSDQNVLLHLFGETKSNGGQMTLVADMTGEILRGMNIGAEIFLDSSLSDAELSATVTVNEKQLLNQMLRVDRGNDIDVPNLSDMHMVELYADGTLSENIDKELEGLATMWGIRLFKVLPAELLTTVMELTDMFQ